MFVLNVCRILRHLPRLSNNSRVALTAAVPLRLTNLTARTTFAVEALPTARTTSAVAPRAHTTTTANKQTFR